jgi:hypothetical protein
VTSATNAAVGAAGGVAHTDWWRCDRCQVKRPQITDDFDYELSSPLCGKAMKLVSREPACEES